MALKCVMPPVQEPVAQDMLRDFLRLSGDDERPLLERLIRVAREIIEQQCGLAMLLQSWQLQLANWPQSGRVALYKTPVQSITEVQAFDHKGDVLLFSADEWRLDTESRPQRLYLCRPPAMHLARGLQISFTAGFGETPEKVPETLRHAVLMLAAHLYEHRSQADTGDVMQPLPVAVEQLLAPWLRGRRL